MSAPESLVRMPEIVSSKGANANEVIVAIL